MWIETATGTSITPDSLEASHHLPSDRNNNLGIIFSRRKDAEMVLSKKTTKGFNPRSIGIESGKVFITESLSGYYKFLWSKWKTLWSEERTEAFWFSNSQIKIRLNLKVKFLELLTSQICRNYFQAMIFSLNKFTVISRHLYRGFCAYICRIYAKTGLGTLPPLGWTSLWH